MRTVTFKSVLHGIAHKMGLDPNTSDFSDELARVYTEYVNERIKQAYEYDFWPELTIVEQRPFRPVWDSTATYAEGDEVLHVGIYYIATAASTGQIPGYLGVTEWEAVGTDFERYVPYEMAGYTPIGEVSAVYARNPRTAEYAGKLAHKPIDSGIWVSNLAGVQVWVEFRVRPPVFTSDEWDAAASYLAGDRVFAGNECWLALQGNTNSDPLASGQTDWQLIEFPYIFSSFVKQAAYADALREDGQTDKANTEEGRAMMEMDRLQDLAFPQQEQAERVTYVR